MKTNYQHVSITILIVNTTYIRVEVGKYENSESSESSESSDKVIVLSELSELSEVSEFS